MFPLPNAETVVRLRRKMVLDPYSQEETLGTWDEADELPIPGCAIAPSSSTEPRSDNRQLVITGMSIYGPPDMDVSPHDRIRARTGTWSVQGEAADWTNAFTGWRPGTEFSIEKVSG